MKEKNIKFAIVYSYLPLLKSKQKRGKGGRTRLKCFEKIETLLDPGPVKYQEDGMATGIHQIPMILAVNDAYSVSYDNDHPIKIINGMSTGEIVTKIFCDTIFSSKSEENLRTIVTKADSLIGAFQKDQGFPLRADKLAGTVFALAKITADNIEILQGGDCTALWLYKNGTVGFTPNPVVSATKYVKEISAKFKQQCNGDMEKARILFTPYLKKEKIKDNNNPTSDQGYPVMNGQLNLEMCNEKTLPLNKLRLLLLFSDGYIPFEWFNDEAKMTKLGKFVEKNGISAHLEKFGNNEGSGFTKKAEIVAVGIWFH